MTRRLKIEAKYGILFMLLSIWFVQAGFEMIDNSFFVLQNEEEKEEYHFSFDTSLCQIVDVKNFKQFSFGAWNPISDFFLFDDSFK